jgi:hypothetical protein
MDVEFQVDWSILLMLALKELSRQIWRISYAPVERSIARRGSHAGGTRADPAGSGDVEESAGR